MSTKSPSHLVRQDSGYCFRYVIPSDLRTVVGKSEIRYSLRTGFIGEAKNKARSMASFVQRLFRDIRKGGRMKELSEAEIKRLIDEHFRQMLHEDEVSRVMEEEPLPAEVHKEEMMGYGSVIECCQADLSDCNYENASKMANRLLAEKGISVAPESYTYRKLCREILKADIQVFEILKLREVGDYSNEVQLSPTPPMALSLAPQEEFSGDSLFYVIDCYLAEQEAGGSWTPKSKIEFGACLSLLKEFLSDIPVNTIDYAKMREYKQALMKLPPNMNKTAIYKGKSLSEILEMDVAKPMAPYTVNKYLNRASCLFEYAVKNGFMQKNPARGMEITINKKDNEQRNVFLPTDLERLFRSEEYLTDSHLEPYCFWTPIIALFTGCRLEEISQLHLDDIKEVDGVWVFDINSLAEKKIKSKAGIRQVPIHPFLRDELKLPQYAEHLRGQSHTRLFPELEQKRDGYGQTVSKWFNAKYKVKCGIVVTNGERKDFHSFRHTFINTLKQSRVDGTMLAEVVGHETGSITMSRYGKQYAPRTLLEDVVEKLAYDVDLSHLKESRFAGKS